MTLSGQLTVVCSTLDQFNLYLNQMSGQTGYTIVSQDQSKLTIIFNVNISS